MPSWCLDLQEPSLYLNGSPVCARPPNKIGEYAELGNVTAEQLEKDEEEFLGEVAIVANNTTIISIILVFTTNTTNIIIKAITR